MAGERLTLCRRGQIKANGYLLAELTVAAGAAAVLGIMCAMACVRCLQGWQYIQSEQQLRECARCIYSLLEKDLGYNARSLSIDDGGKITYSSIQGNKTVAIYLSKNILYQKITTGNGSGINPVSLENIKISQWQAQALQDAVLVRFTLTHRTRTKEFNMLLPCYNAKVEPHA